MKAVRAEEGSTRGEGDNVAKTDDDYRLQEYGAATAFVAAFCRRAHFLSRQGLRGVGCAAPRGAPTQEGQTVARAERCGYALYSAVKGSARRDEDFTEGHCCALPEQKWRGGPY